MNVFNDPIFKRAVDTFGAKSQAGQAMEECGELVTALHKYFFRPELNFDVQRLAEEIADVEIMCEQMRVVIGSLFIDLQKTKKLNRLQDKLDDLTKNTP